jgi:hypothetical protein
VAHPFPFARNDEIDIARYDFVARVRADIQSEESLFAELAHKLSLPPHFGRNWDALNECLSELDWLSASRIALLHEGAPHLPRKKLVIYLSILDTSRVAQEDAGRVLTVGFPQQTRALTDAWSSIEG